MKLFKVKQPLHQLFDRINSTSPISRRIIKGLGANAFGQFVNIMTQLFSVPIFLHYWGADLYGQWLILASIPSYLSMSDIGFGSVAGNEMAMLIARQDYRSALRVFQSAWMFIICVCSVVGLLTAICAYLLPFATWFNLHSLSQQQVSLLICLLAAYTLVSQPGGLIDAAFRSDGRYAEGTALVNIVRLAEMALVLVSVVLGGKLVTAAAIFLLARMMGTYWIWLMFKRNSSWLKIGYDRASFKVIQQLFRPAVAFMVFPLSQAFIFQGMNLVVGGILGSVAVVVFTTSRTVTRVAIQLITLVNHAVWPEFSSAFGSRNLVLARNLHHKVSFFSLWLSVLCSVVLVFIGPWLLDTWTAKQIDVNVSLFYVMLILVISSSVWHGSSIVLMSTNTHGGLAKISLVASLGAIASAYVLLKTFGIVAAPIALLVADISIGFYATRRAIQILEDSFAGYIRSLFKFKVATT